MKAETPYGAWPSPITTKLITQSGVRMGSISVSDEGALHWLEGRPQEAGRQVVVRYAPGEEGTSSRDALDQTPKETNVRTRVHEYGGGAYLLAPSSAGGGIIYSEFTSQRLFWTKAGTDEPMSLTPDFPEGRYRFADGHLDPSGGSMVVVREDHGPNGDAAPKDVVNEVVSLKLDGSGAMTLLATGRDFYAHPRLSADGDTLAYVTWDHPSMPWDSTELRVTSVRTAADTPDTSAHMLADGADGDTSVLQPTWHPLSGALYWVSDSSGFYQIMRMAPLAAGASSLTPASALTAGEVDFGGKSPGWSLSEQGYAFLPDGTLVASYPDRATGRSQLLLMDDNDDLAAAIASRRVLTQGDGLPYMFGSLTPAPDGTTMYMLGGAPDAPSGVYAWRGCGTPSGEPIAPAEMLACSSSADVDPGFVSVPEPVTFPSPLGASYGYYYGPANATCECTTEAAPPLLVKAHGGPTSCTSTGFNPSVQFWTSRGFAVLDVDYGGSTGYGKEYRRRLRKSWGIVDVDDVCAGAEYLVSKGLADGERLCIDGGSAGGFTTLGRSKPLATKNMLENTGALAFKSVFTAGCSLYGVADLGVLASDTHKFESRYLDGLVGPYPEDKALYDERAPINAVDKLSCPILLLQGDEDKIVPPNQAELMHEALLAKGLPCALKMYKGEQHGFRKAENIEDALNSELYFYSRVFGFQAAGDDIKPFTIDNLPAEKVA